MTQRTTRQVNQIENNGEKNEKKHETRLHRNIYMYITNGKRKVPLYRFYIGWEKSVSSLRPGYFNASKKKKKTPKQNKKLSLFLSVFCHFP